MNFFKKIKEIFPKDLKALFKTEEEEEEDVIINYADEVPDIVFKGGWEEDGEAKWATFKPSSGDKIEIKEEKPAEIKDSPSKKEGDISKEKVPSDSEVVETEEAKEDRIKVFFVEDGPAFQNILKTVIRNDNRMELTGMAEDGEEAVAKIKKMKSNAYPEVILMDIAMPCLGGIEATEEILKINPNQKIIMLTAFGDRDNVINAFAAGAIGFLRKDAGVSMIKDSIIKVAQGEAAPIQDEVASFLLEGL